MDLAELRARIPSDLWALLERYHFDFAAFCEMRARAPVGPKQNRTPYKILPPQAGDVYPLPARHTREHRLLAQMGADLIRSGAVACVVLAGGMATRFGGVVKAMVTAADGKSFLELKRRDLLFHASRLDGTIPLLLMSSFNTHGALVQATSEPHDRRVPLSVFPQSISLRLTDQGDLFLEDDGRPSPYAPGHGDLPSALVTSGAFEALRSAGIQYVVMTNIDNLVATLEPAIIGAHVTHGQAMTFEVIPPLPEDQGGRPARIQHKLQVLEAFRFPEGFELSRIPYFSTNSIVFDLQALRGPFPLSWFWVEKTVHGRPAVQFERVVNELSAFLSCRALLVPRDGDEGRFLPIKEPQDLETSHTELERVLRLRGVLTRG